jgi:hypothetical protein
MSVGARLLDALDRTGLAYTVMPAAAIIMVLFVTANWSLKAGLGVNDMSTLIEIAAALNNGTATPPVESSPK